MDGRPSSDMTNGCNSVWLIDFVVRRELEDNGTSLDAVKTFIEETNEGQLSKLDHAYVERTYITLCKDKCFQETADYFKNEHIATNPILAKEILDILEGLNTLRDLNESPFPRGSFKYCKILSMHQRFIKETQEKAFIREFKNQCLKYLIESSSSVNNALSFLHTFTSLLKHFKDFHLLSKELQLKDFYEGKITFETFLTNIMELKMGKEKLLEVQNVVPLVKGECYGLMDKLKETIKCFLNPLEMKIVNVDGRVITEVMSQHMVISHIKDNVENELHGRKVEEVRFVCDAIHIDQSFESSVWHGINVVVCASLIVVHDSVKWDVSGEDNIAVEITNPGIRENGDGNPGVNGQAGESGGNVLMLSEEIINADNLTIISHGGKGSHGHNGENGRYGRHGVGILKENFYDLFPPVSTFFTSPRTPKVLQTLKNIKRNVKNVNFALYGEGQPKPESVEFLETIITQIEINGKVYNDIYLDITTNDGHQIVFSFDCGGWWTNCQSFLLHKGSTGERGGKGGECGLGGNGGYAGEIEVIKSNSYQTDANDGENGKNGIGGLQGTPGNNGCDMAYMDYSVSQFFTKKWPKYLGEDGRTKLNLKYYDADSDGRRIWCTAKESYADIIPTSVSHNNIQRFRERNEHSTTRHQIQATKKKTISSKNVFDKYSNLFTSIDSNLQSAIEKSLQRAMETLTKLEEEELSTEVTVKRHAQFPKYIRRIKRKCPRNKTDLCPQEIPSQDVNALISKLKIESQSKQQWMKLKDVEMNCIQLTELFHTLNKINFKNKKTDFGKEIEEILIEKYRFATLEELADCLSNLTFCTNLKVIESIVEPKYLVVAENQESKISDQKFGLLDHYLHNDSLIRDSILKYLEELPDCLSNFTSCTNLNVNESIVEPKYLVVAENQESEISRQKEDKSGPFQHTLKTFVLRVGAAENGTLEVEKCYRKYNEFLKKREHSLGIYFEAFKSEITQGHNKAIYDLWIKSSHDDKAKIQFQDAISKGKFKLKNEINKDKFKLMDAISQGKFKRKDATSNEKFLWILYKKWIKQQSVEFSWNNHEELRDELIKDIQKNGPSSAVYYTEFLAYLFNINILQYDRDDKDHFILVENHNPTAHTKCRFLKKNNKFILLDVDKEYFHLSVEYEKLSSIYSQILSYVNQCTEKDEFDSYLHHCKSSSDINVLKITNKTNRINCTLNQKCDIDNILRYFPEVKENEQIRCRLEKISCQYSGKDNILHSLSTRFSADGRHISTLELTYFLNSVLSAAAEDKITLHMLSWIITTRHQNHWIVDFLVIKLQLYLKRLLQKKEKSKWINFLNKIENRGILLLLIERLDEKGRVSAKVIEETLDLLSNIGQTVSGLKDLGLAEWKYYLKDKYWSFKFKKTADWTEEEVQLASYYLTCLENSVGFQVVEMLLSLLERKTSELKHESKRKIVISVLICFHNGDFTLCENVIKRLTTCGITKWEGIMNKIYLDSGNERHLSKLIELIKMNANTSDAILEGLKRDEKIICHAHDFGSKITGGEGTITKELSAMLKNNVCEKWSESGQEDMWKASSLALVSHVIKLKTGLKIRDTQHLAITMLLTNVRNTLAQVSTGEGKSLIVVAAAIIKAIGGEKIDVITSSSVLAKRDVEQYKAIYEICGVSVSHNCSEDVEVRKQAYSNSQVVYGDLSSFQRDYLLDRIYKRNILGDRTFGTVIVDEVDSMLLDKGNNMLYLSHDIPGLDKLQSIFLHIWYWLNQPVTDGQLASVFDVKVIKESILHELFGLIKKEDIGELDTDLEQHQVNRIWKHLVDERILTSDGKLLKQDISDGDLNMASDIVHVKNQLKYLLETSTKKERIIKAPNYLLNFIEQHLEEWITSGINAFFMQNGQHYIVDVDRSGSSDDLNPNITILDTDTGTDQANSQWEEALHQFLQLKHGCKLSSVSLKAVFISNVSYFKEYKHLYGLTGTLGSMVERQVLMGTYNVDFVTIPTAKSKKFVELQPILCTYRNDWISNIVEENTKLCDKEGRSVLIICETVKDVESIQKAFERKNTSYLHTYTRDYEEFVIAKGTLELSSGQIIIATNLAGRGTDIKISKELEAAGGLHVCLTYLPSNGRVEQQAFGRSARKGEKGSGQLIIKHSVGGCINTNLEIIKLKEHRDETERSRVSDIKSHYKMQILQEERVFTKFWQQYDDIKGKLNSKNEKVKDILLKCCLDGWAFWLDRNSKYIAEFSNKSTEECFIKSLNEFLLSFKQLESENCEDWSIVQDPVQAIKLALAFCEINQFPEAIRLFDRVILEEPNFSETAHYYKAYASTKLGNFNDKTKLKTELRQAARLIRERMTESYTAAGIIDKLKQSTEKSIIQIDSFTKQQINMCKLYDIFLHSIMSVLGHEVSKESFVDPTVPVIDEWQAEIIFKNLLKENVLLPAKVKKHFSIWDLCFSPQCGLSIENLNEFLLQFKGENIMDENEFCRRLKRKVQLPSREGFWKLLLENHILSDEIKYVIVDNNKLEKKDPSSFHHLQQLANIKDPDFIKEYGNIASGIWFSEHQSLNMGKSTSFMIEKNKFKNLFRGQYYTLKKKGVLTFNKHADINLQSSESLVFPHYDSITSVDLTANGICNSDAEVIFKELVCQGVLKKINDKYLLMIHYTKIAEIELIKCPVYTTKLIEILPICFAYKVALQKLEDQLKEGDVEDQLKEGDIDAQLKKGDIEDQLKEEHVEDQLKEGHVIHLSLMMNLHIDLFYQMKERNIIKPVRVSSKPIDLEQVVNGLYPKAAPKKHYKKCFEDSGLLPEEIDPEKLVKELIQKDWLINIQYLSKTETEIVEYDMYVVNEKLQPERKTLHHSFHIVKETVEHILCQYSELSKEDTINAVKKCVRQLTSPLKVINTPSFNLKPMEEVFGNYDIANCEAHIFHLNSFDQLLTVEEKRWTILTMFLNGVVEGVVAVCQIAASCVIDVLTGWGTQVTGIDTAISSLASGFMTSIHSYAKCRLLSFLTKIFNVLHSFIRGTRAEQALAYAAPYATMFRKRVVKMTGTQLTKVVGKRAGVNTVINRIVSKTVQGVAIGMGHTLTDNLNNQYLKGFCENIGKVILSDIEECIDKHDISAYLEVAYRHLGYRGATHVINHLTGKYYDKKYNIASEQKWSTVAGIVVNNIVKQFSEATAVTNCTGNNWQSRTQTLYTSLTWVNKASDKNKVRNLIEIFLNNLSLKIFETVDEEINKEKENTVGPNPQRYLQHDLSQDKSFLIFKMEVIKNWKMLICEEARIMISQKIVDPILYTATTYVITNSAKTMQDLYQTYKEMGYFEHFQELKSNYEQPKENSDESGTSTNYVNDEYNKALLKLFGQTKDSKLFSAILRENVPMDANCFETCIKVLATMLKEKGIDIPGITVHLEGDGGSQTFSSAEEGKGALVVVIRRDEQISCSPQENQFLIKDGFRSLFKGLSDNIHQLSETYPDHFRLEVADRLLIDRKLQDIITYGSQQFMLDKGKVYLCRINYLNITSEQKTPYQHDKLKGWHFNRINDVDLRENRELSRDEKVDQLIMAFDVALNKINQYLYQVQDPSKPLVSVTHEDFYSKKYNIGIIGEEYLVEVKSTLELEIQHKEPLMGCKFHLTIDLNNPVVHEHLNGPRGPYVGYAIVCNKFYKYEHVQKKRAGHVLINENNELPRKHNETCEYTSMRNIFRCHEV